MLEGGLAKQIRVNECLSLKPISDKTKNFAHLLMSDVTSSDYIISYRDIPVGVIGISVYPETLYIKHIKIAEEYRHKHYGTHVVRCLLPIYGGNHWRLSTNIRGNQILGEPTS